jgi:ERCC4-type nuclease
MIIQIDDRTGSKELAQYFPPGSYELRRLDSADFMFDGVGSDGHPIVIGIERKTVHEIIGDYDRFVANQLEALMNTYHYAYLVVEGPFRPSARGGYVELWEKGKWQERSYGPQTAGTSYIGLIGKLNTLRRLYGITVVRSATSFETAAIVRALAVWFGKDWSEHKSCNVIYHEPPPYALPTRPTLLVKLLACIDGIGWDKAFKLARKFRSMDAVMAADAAAFMEIEGIGRKTAQQLVDMLHWQYT